MSKFIMDKAKKHDYRQLAALMLDINFPKLVAEKREGEVDAALEKKYGITLENFCQMVWDMLDFVPTMTHQTIGKQMHVLGAMINSSLGRNGFMAVVLKEDGE